MDFHAVGSGAQKSDACTAGGIFIGQTHACIFSYITLTLTFSGVMKERAQESFHEVPQGAVSKFTAGLRCRLATWPRLYYV